MGQIGLLNLMELLKLLRLWRLVTVTRVDGAAVTDEISETDDSGG